MEIAKVYPLDAVYDNLDDVPEDVSKFITVIKIKIQNTSTKHTI